MHKARVGRMMLALSLVAASCGIVSSPLSASPSASRPPTATERSILVELVRAYVESTCCDHVKRIKIDYVIVSRADPRWAEVVMQAWDRQLTFLGGEVAVLHRGGRTGKWSLRSFDPTGVLCGVPPRVQLDLGLTCH
jgi:hypothetical protein